MITSVAWLSCPCLLRPICPFNISPCQAPAPFKGSVCLQFVFRLCSGCKACWVVATHQEIHRSRSGHSSVSQASFYSLAEICVCLLKVGLCVRVSNHRCHFSLSFLKRLSCQAQREHVSIKVRPIRGVRTEACSRHRRVGLTHTEAQKWACHSERGTLPRDINAHWLDGETSASHSITIWNSMKEGSGA